MFLGELAFEFPQRRAWKEAVSMVFEKARPLAKTCY
jgi:hypothetical protein